MAIARWYQPNNLYDKAKDIKSKEEDFQQLRGILAGENQKAFKFTKLEAFDFCSTWFPLDFAREVIDEQNDHALSFTGNRDVELIYFALKNQLIQLHLGQWAYDGLVIYLVEICKELEVVEINSDQVTDKSIAELLKKLKYLRVLDLAGCPNLVGVAFSDASELLASDKIRKIVLGSAFRGHSMQIVQDRVHAKQPNVVFELNEKKKFNAQDFQ